MRSILAQSNIFFFVEILVLGVQPFDDDANFTKYVTEPILNMKAIGLSRLRTATSFCAFRRTKDHVKKAVALPNKMIDRVLVDFGEGTHATNHDMFYDTLRAILHKLLDVNTPSEEKKGGVRLLFTMLVRIKQSCCHAELIPKAVRDQALVAYELRDKMDNPMQLLELMKTPDDVDKTLRLGPDFDPRSPKIVALLEQIAIMPDDEKVRLFCRGSLSSSKISTIIHFFFLLCWSFRGWCSLNSPRISVRRGTAAVVNIFLWSLFSHLTITLFSLFA
jgi:hypothetical protein